MGSSLRNKKRLKPPCVWLVENNLWWHGVNLLRSTPDESHPQCQCWPGFKKWVESYQLRRQPRRVQYQIQFIPRLGLESVGLGWLDQYYELTRSTQKKKKKQSIDSLQKKPITTRIKFFKEIRDSSAKENPWKFETNPWPFQNPLKRASVEE